MYLNANDLITFCYVPKYFRELVLKFFSKVYDISTGFRRSCDRNSNYCKICSRVPDNDFYDIDKFSNVTLLSYSSYLDILSEERFDFDVFCVNAPLLVLAYIILIRHIKNVQILTSLILQEICLQLFAVF